MGEWVGWREHAVAAGTAHCRRAAVPSADASAPEVAGTRAPGETTSLAAGARFGVRATGHALGRPLRWSNAQATPRAALAPPAGGWTGRASIAQRQASRSDTDRCPRAPEERAASVVAGLGARALAPNRSTP